MNDRWSIETLKNVKLLSKEMARSLCGIRVYRETAPCRLDSLFPQVSFPVTFQLDAHTYTHALSLLFLSVWRRTPRKKRKKGRGRGERKKRKGLEKKADRWKRFNYRAHPLTGGGSLFAAGERKWKSLCKWRASLLRKRYFEDRVGVERIEKEKEGGGKSGKGQKRFRGCVAMSCNCMLPMKFRPCVSTSSFSVLCFRVCMCVYIYVYIYIYALGEIIFRRSSSSTSLS